MTLLVPRFRLSLLPPLLAVALVACLSAPTEASAQGTRRVDNEPRPALYRDRDGRWVLDLPPALEDALDRYNRDFEPWSSTDYRAQALPADYESSPRQTPWAVIADFNGDGRLDVMLAGRTDRDAVVVLLLSSGTRRYRAVEVDAEPYDVDDRDARRFVRPPVLQYMYPGRYVVIDKRLRRPTEVVVEQPAVQITGGYRQGATLYTVEHDAVQAYYLSQPTSSPKLGTSKTETSKPSKPPRRSPR